MTKHEQQQHESPVLFRGVILARPSPKSIFAKKGEPGDFDTAC